MPLAAAAVGRLPDGVLLYLMMPFIFLGELVLAHPRAAPIRFGYNFLLLIMRPPSSV